MNFEYSEKVKSWQRKLTAFMDEYVYPNEQRFNDEVEQCSISGYPPLLLELRAKARTQGLWNLFLPHSKYGAGFTNLEYAPLCEVMGRVYWAPFVFNCNAPDTGNMETLERYGTEPQKHEWLEPLLAGEISSNFAMTEPDVASSDATNIQATILSDGDHYVVNGRKWWSSGIMNDRCKIIIFMGKTDPDGTDRYRQQSMILIPRDTPGVKVLRHLSVFGYPDIPNGHGDVLYENVRVPKENVLLGEGRGFEIAQGRLGPGRIHHCMRLIGAAERALELMCRRVRTRSPFGKTLAEQGVTRERIAEARIMIEQARLLTLKTAYLMDTVGNKIARREIAMIKVAAPNMALQVIDWAIQAHGGAGVCQDFPLAHQWARARILRLADGPDEVHRDQIARQELGKYREEGVRV